MSKIAIISRGDQAILIDISGCTTFKEAIEQLSSTLLSTNQFWQGQSVDLNLGNLSFNKPEVGQIIALANGVGASPKQVFAKDTNTLSALAELAIPFTKGNPIQLSSVSILPDNLSVAQTNGEADNEVEPTSKSANTANEEAKVSEANRQSEKQQPLYLKQTLRAGQAVSHKGDLIIVGDVNAGAEISAAGDITVWGSLRGIAHAGMGGNTNAEIRALRLQPIQIRIANLIARSPDQAQASGSITGPATGIVPETAKLVDGKIRIVRNTFD